MQAASPTPADRLSALIVRLVYVVDARRIGNYGGFIPVALLTLIIDRTREISQRFRRLADRIRAGWVYQPKPYTPRPAASPAQDKPADQPQPPGPPPGQLPTTLAWLEKLAPCQQMTFIVAGLSMLLMEPDMAAVLAAAPGPAWRILRPLCRMLGVPRPAFLALPPRPRKPKKPKRRKARKAAKRAKPSRAAWTVGPLHPYTADFPHGIPDKLLPPHLRKAR